MIELLRRMVLHKPRPVPDDARHAVTLRRADRLLRLVEAYRKAEARRKNHPWT